jgi:HK97 family phage portal protein
MIVQSFGALALREAPYSTPTYHYGGSLNQASAATYAALYRTQPEVRTVIDFLARNVAQIGLHTFRRVSDTDRQRLADHQIQQWTDKPNPATTRYRLFETLMQDYGIYYNAYWLKLRFSTGAIGLVRVPSESIYPVGWLLPDHYVWTWPDGTQQALPPSELVVFHGFDPCDPLMGLSPLETLRQLLCETQEANSYRQQYWRNASRHEGIIERPLTAPKWNPELRAKWREQWQERFAGAANAGMTPVLEDGMTFKPMSYSAKDSEFTDTRKLSREEVARAYHVPLPMVGILDHATFSNIKEQHKQLYQDCLGPWLKQISEEIERQLLIECSDQQNVYLEFNINEKLSGSFEETSSSIATLVGRPIMTANEGRARLNLPGMKNDPTADQLAQQQGGPSSTTTGSPSFSNGAVAVLRRNWMRQRARLERIDVGEKAAAFDVARYDHELADDLEPIYLALGMDRTAAARAAAAIAHTVNTDTLQLLVDGQDPFAAAREAALYAE